MTLPPMNWSYPTSVKFGAGRIAELPQHVRASGIRAPLLVTDRALAALPITAQALDALDAGGLGRAVFSGVDANPTEDNMRAGIETYRAGAVEPFDQHLNVAVRQFQTLHDVGDTAHRVDVLGLRVVGRGVLLCRQEDPLVFRQRVFERACRRRSSDDERHHYVRKHDDVAEWDNREGFVDFHKGAEPRRVTIQPFP